MNYKSLLNELKNSNKFKDNDKLPAFMKERSLFNDVITFIYGYMASNIRDALIKERGKHL